MNRILLLLPVILGLALVTAFLRLGQWQADRAAFKEALFDRFDRASILTPQPLPEALGRLADPAASLSADSRFLPVVTGGRWLSEVSIYLENQTVEGRDGVHRFVPLAEPDGTVRLINLGWRPVGARRALPEPGPLPPAEALVGLLVPPPAAGLKLGELGLAGQQSPFRVPWIDLAALGERLNLALAPQVLLATAPSPVYRRSWRPTTLPADRHRGYAFQWRALALAVAVLTCWGLWRLGTGVRTRRQP